MQLNYETIALALDVKVEQVAATAALIADGATIPFIARYRKEATGLLDEIQITSIRDQLVRLADLDKRRETIVASLADRDLLTQELTRELQAATNLAELEDIYLPFRPKRRTRSMIARGKGLEPLARAIMTQDGTPIEPERFIDPAKEVLTGEDALAGARDIMAEWVSEDSNTRSRLRQLFADRAVIASSVIKKNQEAGTKFRDYFGWRESAAKAPGHRILAMLRGENDKVLTVSVRPPEEEALALLHRNFVKKKDFAGRQVRLAVTDSYKRLLAPSLETELRNALKERADHEAIRVFADNLRELLLAPPVGQKRVMALDPGFRTGAKLVCLDGQGRLLHFTTVYPTHGGKMSREAAQSIIQLCAEYEVEAIAIGNGTAGRETEEFVRGLNLPTNVIITMVDESGASVYSASEIARAEFPDQDVTVRGSVSIGRRLQDPLAELVKIDPKAIGVGQYQHDVDQAELKKSLDDVVMSCVNRVGVELNTASMELLTRVSGLGPALAGNIVRYRNEHGPFAARHELLKVPRLGTKAYEQCAGFLRIHGAQNPLDASGVHPESYPTVERMAEDAGCTLRELMTQETARQRIDLDRYVNQSIGLPTLRDIMGELAKPGRDPRATFTAFAFAAGITSIDDLTPGMQLPGVVTNVTKFGAFVDIGVHQDGLVHISQLADRFVKDPAEVVKVRQRVLVRVLEVDRARKRIGLSLRKG